MNELGFSAQETRLVENGEVIFLKNNILKKVEEYLAAQVKLINNHFDGLETIFDNYKAPKISRGENYRGLPFRMLDHPSSFSKHSILAIRTMFWWGNFFSVTLHISGNAWLRLKPGIVDQLPLLPAELFICVNSTEWEHHQNADNYKPLLKNMHHANNAEFFKLCAFFPLTKTENFQQGMNNVYMNFAALLKNAVNFRGDEKDPLPGIPTIGSGL